MDTHVLINDLYTQLGLGREKYERRLQGRRKEVEVRNREEKISNA